MLKKKGSKQAAKPAAKQAPKGKSQGAGAPPPPAAPPSGSGPRYCPLCDIQCVSHEQFEAHCTGKKHQKRVAAQEDAALLMAERDAERAEHGDLLDGPPDFQGFLQKLRKCDTGAELEFDERWFELRGGFLVYRAAPSTPVKGILPLAAASVERWWPPQPPPPEDPPEVSIQEDDDGGDSLYASPLGMTPTTRPEGSSLPPPLELGEREEASRRTEEPAVPYFALSVEGGAFTRPLVLKMSCGVELDSWGQRLRDTLRRADEADREVERKELQDDAKGGTRIVDRQSASGYRRPDLADFELLTVVGRGSFGKVLKVNSRADGRVFAMKVINKHSVIEHEITDKVMAEMRSLAEANHPFLVTLHHAFQTATKLFLVMPFYTGGDLKFHLKSRGKFREPWVQFYGAQLTLALGYLHNKSILYRDLKPANVVLGGDGYAVLADFGLAKRADGLRADSFCGTDAYVAPEMVREEPYNSAVDWWSLGVVLYELSVGSPPFWNESPTMIYDLITGKEPSYPNSLSPPLAKALRGLLHKKVDKRVAVEEKVLALKFFEDIDIPRLLAKQLKAPIVPDTAKSDTRYFDLKFTQQRPELTHCQPLAQKHQDPFADFNYPRLSVS
eukprot:Hpha_TRINITY_DN11000_c0_g2::TRINITY_DN11000_c0_g2_i1::g.93055::m.93055